MSDSLSSADRDARIAAIENFHALVLRGGGGYNSDIIRAQTAHITTLLAELRAALSREEEAKKDAERLDVLSHALRHWDPELGMCIGDVFLSGGHRGVSVEVGNKIQEARGDTLREALDATLGER